MYVQCTRCIFILVSDMLTIIGTGQLRRLQDLHGSPDDRRRTCQKGAEVGLNALVEGCMGCVYESLRYDCLIVCSAWNPFSLLPASLK